MEATDYSMWMRDSIAKMRAGLVASQEIREESGMTDSERAELAARLGEVVAWIDDRHRRSWHRHWLKSQRKTRRTKARRIAASVLSAAMLFALVFVLCGIANILM